jgi:hypothetical protein
MRLINTRSRKLEEFVGDNIPEYAILSHTWGNEEVTFQDWSDPEAASGKAGFAKIALTCQQALEDGLEYCWVDTNCIDKSSSTELSEAINSMFSWYYKSSICYAYLTDVDVDGRTEINSGTIDQQIRKSLWFTRGWTLQELLAPRKLSFFSKQGTHLGFKEDKKHLVSEITGIDQRYLDRRKNIRSASIAERMSWMRNRVTTRTEDMAYCLLGIFNIHMALLYGEGQGAFRRLQEEIIRVVNDQTIFCWSHRSPMVPKNWASILAPHPAAFQSSMNFCRNQLQAKDTVSYDFTNAGLAIELPIIHMHQGIYAIFDVSPDEDDHSSRLGIPLRQIRGHGSYSRIRIAEDPVRVPTNFLRAAVPRRIEDYSPVIELLTEMADGVTTSPEDVRANHTVSRKKLYIQFREDEDFKNCERGVPPARIFPALETQAGEVRCRLYITFDVPVNISIPSTLKGSQSSTGNLRFSRKWSMVEARLNHVNDSGVALLELHPMKEAKPLKDFGRFFCLLCVRRYQESGAHWSIFAFCLSGAARIEIAIKLQCQSSLPIGKTFSSPSYNYIQRNFVANINSYGPSQPVVRDVFHVELGRGNSESREIVVDELFQAMSTIRSICGREIDYLTQLTKNIAIQRKIIGATPRKRAAEGHDPPSHPSRACSYRTWQKSEPIPLKRSDSVLKTDKELLESKAPEPHRQTNDFDGNTAALDAYIKANLQKLKMSEQRIRKEALAKQWGQVLRNIFRSVTYRPAIKRPRKQAVSLRLTESPTIPRKGK